LTANSGRFYQAKKRLLGYKQLYEWDRYSPIFPQESPQYSWLKNRQVILKAFASFSPQFAQTAQLFFEQKWIDAKITTGKDQGAFCSFNVPCKHPYVFLNFTGKISDVSTLAHELGHAIHAYLARSQNFLNFWP